MSRLRESQKQSEKLMRTLTRLAQRYSISQDDLVRLSEFAAHCCHRNVLGRGGAEADRSVDHFVALLREMRERFGMKPEDALEFAQAAIGFSVESAWQELLGRAGVG